MAIETLSNGTVTAAYIASAVLFILSLSGLSNQETSRRGNWYGIIGMTIAIVATVLNPNVNGYVLLIIAMLIGGTIGARMAAKVEMTQMPELVAILHSFVGMAAVLVGFASYFDPNAHFEGSLSRYSNWCGYLYRVSYCFR